MGARQKVNGIHMTGVLFMAGLAARLWMRFLLGAGVLLGISTYTGGIRPRRHR
jgi:hypothetical protein